MDGFSGWSIRFPWGGLYHEVHLTRGAAIASIMINYDKACFAEAKAEAENGRPFITKNTSPAIRKAWARYRAKGYTAVYVHVEACDCRISKGDTP